MIDASDIQAATKKVTKEWTRQRKAEERGRPQASREYTYSDRVNFTDVADDILPDAYDHASGGGKYSVAQRQLFYASRAAFKEETGRELDYNYFTGTLLRKFINQNPDLTATWQITADPRGSLILPNAGHEVRIPCGTLQINKHLSIAASNGYEDINPKLRTQWPSLAAGHRYQGVLYIEKEGFGPILEEARIAEHFDIAILSCKGQSVTAARKYVDTVCAEGGGVPLFVAHDFDKAGFEIYQCLHQVSIAARESDRVSYEFSNKINATDLGLRLSDVEEYGLADEACEFRGKFAHDSPCTKEERDFLRSDRRVELNAFTSPQLIEWLEARLTEHGMGKRLVPSLDVLEDAYRRAMVVSTINSAIEDIQEDAVQTAEEAKIPKNLGQKLRAAMKDQDEPWDKVLYDLVTEKVKNGASNNRKKQGLSGDDEGGAA
jgi:hypothetical protein